ncbi:9772_t:CDS:2 [Funneliformis geosporum]|uniref:3445_t:CDS:1 n=1 Tax=Funneliformis geosporum TaxID=1117311 RepID=A0A9W4SRZ6_9GLOM|nr:3445_t:CDS:2 [Funneliformis geosporum]CAI2192761.1 9772_t:CDS:2 [Funneliformis geosporum]
MSKYAKLMERCWNSNANNRPTAKELVGYFVKLQNEFFSIYTERIPTPENAPIINNHPLSCYTSRRIDYSAKLNEIFSENTLEIARFL